MPCWRRQCCTKPRRADGGEVVSGQREAGSHALARGWSFHIGGAEAAVHHAGLEVPALSEAWGGFPDEAGVGGEPGDVALVAAVEEEGGEPHPAGRTPLPRPCHMNADGKVDKIIVLKPTKV